MSYEFYIIVHISSLFALFASSVLIPLCSHPLKQFKKQVLSTHGLSTLLSFVSGFGLIAKANIPLQMHHHWLGYGMGIVWLLLWVVLLCVRSPFASNIGSLFWFYAFCISPALFLNPFWLGLKISIWMTFAFSPLIWKKLSLRQDYFYLQYLFLITMVTLAVILVFLKP